MSSLSKLSQQIPALVSCEFIEFIFHTSTFYFSWYAASYVMSTC